LPLSIYISNT